MDPTAGPKLAHGSVHDGVAGLPLTPSVERRRVVDPTDTTPFRSEWRLQDLWMMVEEVQEELTPNQLGEPRLGRLLCGRVGGRCDGAQCSLHGLSSGEHSESQVGREARGAP